MAKIAIFKGGVVNVDNREAKELRFMVVLQGCDVQDDSDECQNLVQSIEQLSQAYGARVVKVAFPIPATAVCTSGGCQETDVDWLVE